jgi:hypothetical protein
MMNDGCIFLLLMSHEWLVIYCCVPTFSKCNVCRYDTHCCSLQINYFCVHVAGVNSSVNLLSYAMKIIFLVFLDSKPSSCTLYLIVAPVPYCLSFSNETVSLQFVERWAG